MSEQDFWRTTPKRLVALAKVHKDVEKARNPSGEPAAEPNKVYYIDQIM